jgi:hypothetical protein
MASPSKNVTLKRTVSIKVVVTEKFKNLMLIEVNSAESFSQQRLSVLEEQLLSTSLPPVVREKLTLEKSQIQDSLRELAQRKDMIAGLALDSHFFQGSVDGFVTVGLGDNLYEKLSAMEILIRDGVIEEVISVGSAFQNLQGFAS